MSSVRSRVAATSSRTSPPNRRRARWTATFSAPAVIPNAGAACAYAPGWLSPVRNCRIPSNISGFPPRGEFATQSRHGPVEQSQRPPPLKDLLRRHQVRRLALVKVIGGLHIQRYGDDSASALGGLRPVPFVGQEVLQGGQKVGAEPAPVAIRRAQ